SLGARGPCSLHLTGWSGRAPASAPSSRSGSAGRRRSARCRRRTFRILPDLEERTSVCDRRRDLEPIPYDAGIAEELLDFSVVIPGHNGRVDLVEARAIAVSFLQDRLPAQPRLCPFENEELEQPRVIVEWHAPLIVVIGNGQVADRPVATPHV